MSRLHAIDPVSTSASISPTTTPCIGLSPIADSTAKVGRNISCSRKMIALEPARSSVPCEQALAVITVRRVGTDTAASITNPNDRSVNTTGPTSGAASSHTPAPSRLPPAAIAISVGRSRRSSRSGPARKYGAATGSPHDASVPTRPGSTWNSA